MCLPRPYSTVRVTAPAAPSPVAYGVSIVGLGRDFLQAHQGSDHAVIVPTQSLVQMYSCKESQSNRDQAQCGKEPGYD